MGSITRGRLMRAAGSQRLPEIDASPWLKGAAQDEIIPMLVEARPGGTGATLATGPLLAQWRAEADRPWLLPPPRQPDDVPAGLADAALAYNLALQLPDGAQIWDLIAGSPAPWLAGVAAALAESAPGFKRGWRRGQRVATMARHDRPEFNRRLDLVMGAPSRAFAITNNAGHTLAFSRMTVAFPHPHPRSLPLLDVSEAALAPLATSDPHEDELVTWALLLNALRRHCGLTWMVLFKHRRPALAAIRREVRAAAPEGSIFHAGHASHAALAAERAA
jgi:hypothetical protein